MNSLVPETPTSAGIKEIKTLQELHSRGFHGTDKAKQVGPPGSSGTVYEFNWSGDGGQTHAVLKLFNSTMFDRTTIEGDYRCEKDALIKLQGLPSVVRLLAFGERNILGHPLLIKEWVGGEDMSDNQAIFPVHEGSKREANSELSEKAKWMVGCLEALAEIHKKDVWLSDFKYEDALWDSQAGRVIFLILEMP